MGCPRKGTDCETCYHSAPELTLYNRTVLWPILRTGFQILFEGFGGFNASGIVAAMSAANIPEDFRDEMLSTAATYYGLYQKHKPKEEK
jgi:hypothetical protein